MIRRGMIESIAALHDAVVANLALADELKLTDVGISLDQARLKLEDELARRAAGNEATRPSDAAA